MTQLYEMIREPQDGEQIQYLGVYALRWRPEWGEPSVAFREAKAQDEAMQQTGVAQLRCIELVVTSGSSYKTRARWLRQQALRKDVPLDIGTWMESLADVLEGIQ